MRAFFGVKHGGINSCVSIEKVVYDVVAIPLR